MADRAGFALAVADRFHLEPTVVLGWTYWENTNASEKLRAFNWLNWKMDADIASIPHTTRDDALDGGWFPGYANLSFAVQAATARISNPRYAGIRSAKGASAQVAAIIASGWGTQHLTTKRFTNEQLMWTWIEWRLGEGWAHVNNLGPRNMAHRPNVFPHDIPTAWYDELKIIEAGRHH